MSAPRVLLGVCGGIAAYKAPEIVRGLRKEGAEVQVILTGRAEEFVAPLTLATLSERPVARTEFGPEPSPTIGHIELARWGDALVVAPATANELARFARGLADDLLSTVNLAFSGPVVVAPAMNPRMWEHPETRENIERLASQGVVVVPPEEGFTACGDEGAGRLARVEAIVAEALWAARRSHSLEGVHVLVSAGPTYEPIDPVRFIGNRSSGKMGYAMASAARRRGAGVTVVRGAVTLGAPWGVTVIEARTAAEMRERLLAAAVNADVVVMAAAVADHRPAHPATEKIHRPGEDYTLSLTPTADILAELSRSRVERELIVGFAAETGVDPGRLERKLERKGCDLLVVNDVTEPGAGFETDTNVVTLFAPGEPPESLPRLHKRVVAERIWDRIETLRRKRSGA